MIPFLLSIDPFLGYLMDVEQILLLGSDLFPQSVSVQSQDLDFSFAVIWLEVYNSIAQL